MYSGRLVEIAPRDALFASPLHPYTRALLAAVPGAPAREEAIPPLRAPPVAEPPVRADPVDPADPAAPLPAPPSGCAFRDRCNYAVAVCQTTVPPLEETAAGHWTACHRAREFTAWPPQSRD
jgi:peptide/nickel transport system ATP-binding protein